MSNDTFGELRALLEQPSMNAFERRALWSLIEEAAATPAFREEWYPYLESKLADLEGPLAVVASIEDAKEILPFATFEQSLVPTIEATAKTLQEQDPVVANFHRREPRALDTWREDALSSKFRLEPILLDLLCWCDGFTLEWIDDLDEDGVPYPDEDNYECTFRRLTLRGVDAYIDAISADILPEADAEIDEAYISFTDGLRAHFDERVTEDELEECMQDSMRIIADFESNSNDLTCANILLGPDGNYLDVEDEWEFELGERTRTLRGCTAFYIGSMIVRDQEFTLYRNLVDSEIAEVISDGKLETSPLADILCAIMTHCFDTTRPHKDIELALHTWRQNQ